MNLSQLSKKLLNLNYLLSIFICILIVQIPQISYSFDENDINIEIKNVNNNILINNTSTGDSNYVKKYIKFYNSVNSKTKLLQEIIHNISGEIIPKLMIDMEFYEDKKKEMVKLINEINK